MKLVRIAVALAIASAPLGTLSTQAIAATAHNSQAGAMGNTTNDAGPTVNSMTKRHMRHSRKSMKKM